MTSLVNPHIKVSAHSIPFIADFDPEFEYEIAFGDYNPQLSENNRFITQPLTVGDSATDFTLTREAGVWQQLPSELFHAKTLSLQQLIDYKPLVISFYSPEWGEYGKSHLDLLDKAHQKITGLGGQLLVFTSLTPDQIPAAIQKNALLFNLVHDADNHIAEQFGVYAPAYPLWQRVAGVNAEVSIPATFVIAHNGTVVYDFVNEDLNGFFDLRQILTAIYSVRDVQLSA